MVFSAPLAPSSSSTSSSSASSASSASSQASSELAESISILSHDVVYWVSAPSHPQSQLGDLNYRITSDVPSATVFHYAQSDFAALLKKDQLSVSQQAGFAFVGFAEPPIAFPPTYKYLRDAALYDQRPEKKLRAPAWCDRVLYRLRDAPRPNQQIPVVITEYDAVASILGSDHRPVFLRSVLLVKQFDESRMVACHNDARRRILAGEAEGPVQPSLDPREICFGAVAFQAPCRRSLCIRNDGDTNLYFRFLPRDSESHVALPLFSVSQLFGVLLPRESVEIVVTLLVSAPCLKVALRARTHSSTFTRMGPSRI